MAPNLTPYGDAVLLSWLEPVSGAERTETRVRRYSFRMAFLRDGTWTAPSTILESDSMFANWADLPSVQRAPDGALIAHWLRKSGAGTYAYDVALTRSIHATRAR